MYCALLWVRLTTFLWTIQPGLNSTSYMYGPPGWKAAYCCSGWCSPGCCPSRSGSGLPLCEFLKPLLVQIFHDFAYILRMLTCGNEQCVLGFHNHQIADSNRGHEFIGSMHVVAARI